MRQLQQKDPRQRKERALEARTENMTSIHQGKENAVHMVVTEIAAQHIYENPFEYKSLKKSSKS